MSGIHKNRLVKITSTVNTSDGELKYLHGTGYFLTPDLILTASHVLPQGNTQSIRFFVEAEPDTWKFAELQPVWKNNQLDAVLLKARQPISHAPPAEFLEALSEEDKTWEATGYPVAATEKISDGIGWKTSDLKGPVYPRGGGGQGPRYLELGVQDPPEGEGWQGISGTPVFINNKLAGIIKSYPAPFVGKRLYAVPIDQLDRAQGFRPALEQQWLTAFPIASDHPKLWYVVLVSESQKSKQEDLGLQVSAAIQHKIPSFFRKDISEDPVVVDITQVLENRGRWLKFVQVICNAPIMIIDVTGFEPAILLMLGIRAVVRRGVTITTISTPLDVQHLSELPFNIQESRLISIADSDDIDIDNPKHPTNRLGQAIRDGLSQLEAYPAYLDLPAYDAVRCPKPKATGEDSHRGTPHVNQDVGKQGTTNAPPQSSDEQTVLETALLLCPFHPDYETNRRYVANRILRVSAKGPVRILDMMSPRLVGQALYEHIRWSRFCLVDWTFWRPNVFFELGVRLACSPYGPICLMDENLIGEPKETAALEQTARLIDLLDPIKYTRNDNSAPFITAWQRYNSNVNSANKKRGPLPLLPFSRLEHDETYLTIQGGAFDWRQEAITKLPHDVLIASVEAQIGETQTETQFSTEFLALFCKQPEFMEALQRNAAERGIAAWYYFLNRQSLEEIETKNEVRQQLIALGNKVLMWLPKRPEYERFRRDIGIKVGELKNTSI